MIGLYFPEEAGKSRAMRKIAYVVMTVWTASTAALAAESPVSGPVAVDVLNVHDGDSFTVLAHMWPEQYIKTHVRVAGVDTPEINGRCERERELARQAKGVTVKFLENGAPIAIRNIKLDKYAGRVDADVVNARGDTLAAALFKAKLAHPYNGGTKRGWCS
jgi:micrococcal nuclease